MAYLINEITPIARKDYYCMACDWINNGIGFNGIGFSFSEYREIVKAKQNGFKIKKGEKYIRQFLNDGGGCYEFIAKQSIHDICVKHDLYCE